ncbi:Clp protease N-terminal domain-containing protein [Micromonospora sp. NPDC049836]|uniref:Clp protease N-terminal domain-containing protein n=1 Tax=Micromonospora sp. NPDC049836 TaxID=3364274 RepID=UPI0037A753BD
MIERFTDRARAAVRRAGQDARAAGRGPAGTAHLLLALLADRDPVLELLEAAGIRPDELRAAAARYTVRGAAGLTEADAAALRTIGIDLAAVLARVEESFGPGALGAAPPARRGGPELSPAAKRALTLARREAARLGHRRIDTGHLLLGLLREGSGPAARALTEAGADLAGLRGQVAATRRPAA